MSVPDYWAICALNVQAAKHVVNSHHTLVVESLKGLVTLNPGIKLDEAQRGTADG